MILDVMLTTGIDFVGPEAPEDPSEFDEVFKSTNGDDTVTAVSSALSADRTLGATDQIDGGDGTDTLSVDMQSNFSGFTGDGALKNVEVLSLTNSGSIDRSFDATGATGIETVKVDAQSGTVSVKDLDSLAEFELSDQASGTVTLAYDAKSEVVTGSQDDIQSITLTDVGTAKTDTADAKYVTVKVANVEGSSLVSNGSANFVNLKDVAGAEVTLAGTADLDVEAVNTAVTSFDATKMTGDLTADLTGTTAEVATVSAGSGDDTVTVDSDDLAINAGVAGGAGADTLVLKGTSVTATTTQYSMSGFQTLNLAQTGSTLTFSGVNVSDLATVNVTETATTAAELVKLAVSDVTVGLKGATADSADLSMDNAGTTVINATGDADNIADKKKTANNADINLGKSTEVTLNIEEYVESGNDLVANAATSLTLNVESGLDSDKAEVTNYTGDITANKADSIVVDAQGKITGTTITADVATSAEVTSGEAASTLFLATKALEALNITANGDLDLTGGSTTLTAVQDLVADTDGHLKVTALNDVANVTISGTDAKSQATLSGVVGAAGNEHGLTVTASGLKAALDFGAAIAADEDIVLDFTGMTGNVTGGAAVTSASGDVTINASGALGTIALGVITAEDVTIDAEGNTKAITINDGTGSAAMDITATTVDITGAELAANGLDIVATAGATAFTADLEGGLKADEYTITADAATESVTVTGDANHLSSTTDTLEITTGAATTSVDASGTSGYNVTVDGASSTGAMTIKTSDGDDIITGGMESDSLTGGTGADDFIMSDVVAGAASVKMDTITDFTVADTDQVGNFGLTDLKTLTILTNLVELDDPAGQSVAADDAVVTDTIAAATDLADVTATTNLLILDADLDDTDAVADALEDSGSLELTAGTAFAAADGFLVAYDDGTDSYIALVTTDAIVAADGTFAADDLTVTNLVTLTGVADCTDLTDASFLDFIA